MLWFAWKIVPLWYQQQHRHVAPSHNLCCDLLEKLYLCGINNNSKFTLCNLKIVVICLKNCTFVVSTTTETKIFRHNSGLWFAWKIVPLWYQQQPERSRSILWASCDLLEKLYLCGINNNAATLLPSKSTVVICLKNCTFVVSTTTAFEFWRFLLKLWFAWKIVPLWYQQQPMLYNYLVINKILLVSDKTFSAFISF